jgi:anti-anti-sigma regulatory factor
MVLQTTVAQVESPTSVTIVSLAGELDAASYERVIDLVRQLHDAGARSLLLDLENLEFISSSGLVAVHSCLRLMAGEAPPDPEYGWEALRAIQDEADRGPQGHLRICGARPAVSKVIDRSGLGRVIPAYPDRAAGLAAF